MAVPEHLPEHSPLGASGAYRWLVCPGSVPSSRGLPNRSSDYAAEGSLAHWLGETCLMSGTEPWQYVGLQGDEHGAFPEDEQPDGDEDGVFTIDAEMSSAVMEYLEVVRGLTASIENPVTKVEHEFYCPEIHPLFYGKSDFVAIDRKQRHLHVIDYKHGAGIVVDIEDNSQLRYYAAGVVQSEDLWGGIDSITIHIVQPRGWHYDGTWRHETFTIQELFDWLWEICVPGMEQAEKAAPDDLTTGEHCRFCPASWAQCPATMRVMQEYEVLMEKANEKGVKALTPLQLGRLVELNEIAKIVMKNAKDLAHKRLNRGKRVPGTKLVSAKTNRVYKRGAEEAAKEVFGRDAYQPKKVRTPSQIEALPGGKDFAAEWAFKPPGGTTVVADSDKRRAINKNVGSLFTPVEKED